MLVIKKSEITCSPFLIDDHVLIAWLQHAVGDFPALSCFSRLTVVLAIAGSSRYAPGNGRTYPAADDVGTAFPE
jgi:hypothetical protein